jgi:hypothetical protein
MHLKMSKTLKIWLSYCQIFQASAKIVDFQEYYYKYVNSSLKLAFLGLIWSYNTWKSFLLRYIYVVLSG